MTVGMAAPQPMKNIYIFYKTVASITAGEVKGWIDSCMRMSVNARKRKMEGKWK